MITNLSFGPRLVAIVGHAADKFNAASEARAREVIRGLLSVPDAELVSGGCHLGGVDIFAEEEADALDVPKHIFLPADRRWSTGYRPRNLRIASTCTEAHCVVVDSYPPGYDGMTFWGCYHCKGERSEHVKSGGCWTVIKAGRMGKATRWHIIPQG